MLSNEIRQYYCSNFHHGSRDRFHPFFILRAKPLLPQGRTNSRMTFPIPSWLHCTSTNLPGKQPHPRIRSNISKKKTEAAVDSVTPTTNHRRELKRPLQKTREAKKRVQQKKKKTEDNETKRGTHCIQIRVHYNTQKVSNFFEKHETYE